MITEKKAALVSIVIATYNGESYLDKQLDSLFKQTYTNIEIIAVDDRSSDNTRQILSDFARERSNMKVFFNEINIGFIKNFEKGCRLAEGEFVSFCDQDDYWDPYKIEKMVKAIEDYPIIYCDSILTDENLNKKETKISDYVNFKSWNNCLQLSVFCRIYAHTMLCRKSFLDKSFPFLDVIPPDWWLPYLSTFYGGMKYLPEPLVLYRQHENNVAGIVGGRRKRMINQKISERKKIEKKKIRRRIQAFYDACPENRIHEKKVLLALVKSYSSFSLSNNLKRSIIFFLHHRVLLAVKKYSTIHRYLFCLKMFFKIK